MESFVMEARSDWILNGTPGGIERCWALSNQQMAMGAGRDWCWFRSLSSKTPATTYGPSFSIFDAPFALGTWACASM
jgi:hypothetical protein